MPLAPRNIGALAFGLLSAACASAALPIASQVPLSVEQTVYQAVEPEESNVIQPTFDLLALQRVRDLPKTMELTGWLKIDGAEIGLYPTRANFGKKYVGLCISGRPLDSNQVTDQKLDGQLVRVTGGVFREADVTPSPSVAYIQNYCGSPIVLFVEHVAAAD